MTPLPVLFEAIRARHAAVYVIVSPPRCGSTAFARVFWEHSAVRYYCHEPFEVAYYRKAGLADVAARLAAPLDLAALNPATEGVRGDSLVVKEMPYQVGEHFPLLARFATKPLVFLLRDPRQNIASRIEKKLAVGDSPFFPLIETGWELIARQIDYCRREGFSYLIVEANDFRNAPQSIFPQVFAAFGLDFTPAMLSWRAHDDVNLDNLDGAHRHLYRRVLASTGIEPATEAVPWLDGFPTEHGVRDHVAECLKIYHHLCRDARRIVPLR